MKEAQGARDTKVLDGLSHWASNAAVLKRGTLHFDLLISVYKVINKNLCFMFVCVCVGLFEMWSVTL